MPTGGMKWRMNLHSIEQNISKIKDFPDFESEKYTGPSLFIGGENSPYIRYTPTVLEITLAIFQSFLFFVWIKLHLTGQTV